MLMTFFDRHSDRFDRGVFKGTQSAGAHAHQLPFHSIPLYITETRSILFLTKYDKNNIIGWAKAHSKTGFSVNDWNSTKTLRRLNRNSRCTLISGWGELFSEWENWCPGQHAPKADCVPLSTCQGFFVFLHERISSKRVHPPLSPLHALFSRLSLASYF